MTAGLLHGCETRPIICTHTTKSSCKNTTKSYRHLPLTSLRTFFTVKTPAQSESGRTDSRSTDTAKGINRGRRCDSLTVAVADKSLTINEKSASYPCI